MTPAKTPWKTRLYDSYVSSEQSAYRPGTEWSIAQFPQFAHVLRNHVPADRGLRIVDLGCGHGTFLRCLEHFGYTRIQGVDVSTEQVELAHRLGRQYVQHGDALTFVARFEGAFDVVFLMEVLEHLDKQSALDLLDSVYRALDYGGRLIVHVPNAEGIFGMRVRYGDLTHETAFTSQSIRQLLRVCGFDSIEVFEERPVVHGLKSLIRLWLWRLLTLRERLLLLAEMGSAAGVLSQNMLVVARKLNRGAPRPEGPHPQPPTDSSRTAAG